MSDRCCTWGRTTPSVTVTALSVPDSVRFLCVRQLLYLGKNYPKCYSDYSPCLTLSVFSVRQLLYLGKNYPKCCSDCSPCLTLSVFSVSDRCCTWGRTTPSVTVTALSVPDSVRFLCVRQLLYLGKNYPKCYSDYSPCLTLSVFSVRQLLYLGKNYPKCYSDCSPCLTLSVFSVSDSCCTWGRTTPSVTVTALRA